MTFTASLFLPTQLKLTIEPIEKHAHIEPTHQLLMTIGIESDVIKQVIQYSNQSNQ